MPELPEVEQVRRTLAPHLLGRKISAVEVYLARQIIYPQPAEFIAGLTGRTFIDIGRRGKYLVLGLDGSRQLIVHLRMTGALLVREDSLPAPAYAKVKFALNGNISLWFTDIRTFGTLYLVTNTDYHIKGLESLGPEPLSEGFTAEYLAHSVAKSRRAVKSLILDQEVIAGLGNIYADESLALAGILPTRCAGTLTNAEIVRLREAINSVIAQGIANRGTTFRDYKDGEGRKGDNQNHLLVYGRKGQPCRKCGCPLAACKVGGRGTTYCPNCQK